MRSHVELTAEEAAFRSRGIALTRRLVPEGIALKSGYSFPVQGEDRSSYQPPGTGGGQFLIAKATEWPRYKDPNFRANRDAAHAAGIPFGIYPFLHLTSSTADQEFELMMSMVGSWRPNEWCMADNEVSWNEPAMCRFSDLVHQSGCRYSTLYSYAGMFAAHSTIQAVHHFDDPHIAAYGSATPSGDRWTSGPTPWWQFTDHDQNGMDRNAFTAGDVNAMLARIGGSAPPPPPPPPQPPKANPWPALVNQES